MKAVETLEEARQLLAEYNALPDDLNARLNWKGYDKLPTYTITCKCGHSTSMLINLDDLQRMVNKGELRLGSHIDSCSKCEPDEDEED